MMKRLQITLGLFLGVIAIAMPGGTLSAQKFWKTDWSPDGTKIVFGFESDIWMIDSGGGVAVNLTENIDNKCYCPVFSPDDTEVMYSKLSIHNSGSSGSETTWSSIESVNPETEERRIILDNAYAAVFSADGRYAAYIKDGSYNAVYDFESRQESVFNFNGIEPPFFCGGHVSICPDDTNFITWFDYGNNTILTNRYKLFRVLFDTGEAEIIELGEGNCVYPRYSPDGSKILFSQLDVDGVYQLAIYDFSTGEVSGVVGEGSCETKCGCWSPDGGRICYILNENNRTSLCIYDIETSACDVLISRNIDDTISVQERSPAGFVLKNNYPNPFNPSTSIGLSLDKGGEISLDIYNIMGQKIRELADGYMTDGYHDIVWNGRDDRGAPVASGVYLYRLKMGEQVMTKRMMLTR